MHRRVRRPGLGHRAAHDPLACRCRGRGAGDLRRRLAQRIALRCGPGVGEGVRDDHRASPPDRPDPAQPREWHEGEEALEDLRFAEPGNGGEVRAEAERAAMVVARLRPEQRKVLSMGLLEGLTHSEIAAATGMPLGTVKTQMRRGLIQVRQWMKIANPGALEQASP
jgi:DNA-directed RNA polymerase specialized sigma24 family protein